jgi:hypothetical protein
MEQGDGVMLPTAPLRSAAPQVTPNMRAPLLRQHKTRPQMQKFAEVNTGRPHSGVQ